MVGGGNNQSVLGMSVHSQAMDVSPRTTAGTQGVQSRKLGHPGAIKEGSGIFEQHNCGSSSNEDTIKRGGTMFEFQKPVIHAGLSSVQGSSSLTGGSSSLIGGAGSGPPNHQSSSTVSQPGITRQTIICDNPSPDIRHEQKNKARGIPSTLVLSESKFIASQNAAGNQMM